jgi:hypothetical protein
LTYLLDVNLLLALADPRHIHHEPAHRWFATRGHGRWATCPITENGFVRIASHPSYPNRPGDARVVLQVLRQFCSLPGHVFWGDEISLRTLLSSTAVLTRTQITDIYLLGLAQHRAGMLATLDRRLPAGVLPEGRGAIELVPAV